MWLFRKAKKDVAKHSMSDKAAQSIASVCNYLQRWFAKGMNKSIGSMNTKRLKATVILFALVFGGISLYLIINGITHPAGTMLHVDQVNVPQHFNKAGDEETIDADYVDEETIRNIAAFRQYMDSLKTFKRPEYDSIIRARPHLMDSVTILEQVYNLQKQNSEYEK